jgi:hypothetical protein
MKKIILLISLTTICLFAENSGSSARPLYKYAFFAQNDNAASLELIQYLKSQVLSTKRGEAILQSNFNWKEDLSTATLSEDFNILEIKKSMNIDSAEKIILARTISDTSQIQMIDVETGKVEYKNSLPDSISKSLLLDFYSFLDKKNIYLALSERKSSPSSPLKFSQLKSKYAVGEAIRFELEALEDNFVYVVLVPNEKGEEPTLLFPNPNQTANFMKKGEKIMIPDGNKSLRAAPPYGRDRIKAFASKEEWNDFQFKNKKGDSFFKLLPPALTGAKAVYLPELMSRTILNTSVAEWQMEILPN